MQAGIDFPLSARYRRPVRRILLLAVLAGALAVPASAGAAPPILENGRFAGSLPPAPPWQPDAPVKSFKIDLIG
jgi:hypothetical protein